MKREIHIHIWLELEKKVNITNPNKLDLKENNDKIIHGNYQPVKNRKTTLEYVTKNLDSITNLNLTEEGKELSFHSILLEITKKEGYEKEKNTKTLVLHGEAGTGKTEGIIALLEEYNPLLIRDINGLKDLKPKNKSIIFDDINFSELKREEIIHR